MRVKKNWENSLEDLRIKEAKDSENKLKGNKKGLGWTQSFFCPTPRIRPCQPTGSVTPRCGFNSLTDVENCRAMRSSVASRSSCPHIELRKHPTPFILKSR